MLERNNQSRLRNATRRHIHACLALLAVLLAIALLPLGASAHSVMTPMSGPTMQISAGFDGRFRNGTWIPVQIALHNPGADFNGVVSIDVPSPYAGSGAPTTSPVYQQAISLPVGAQKQVTLYVPFNPGVPGPQNITISLIDNNGHQVSSQRSVVRALGSSDIFVGLLADPDQAGSGFNPLSVLPLPDQAASVITQPLDATNMPTLAEALNNFDMLVLDNFTTSSLSQEQLSAIQNWVNQGGKLIAIGGPQWRSTLSPLPSGLLPVNITGSTTLPPNTPLLPSHGPPTTAAKLGDETISKPISISTATASANSSVLLSSGSTPNAIPLIVQSRQGAGQVYYLAYDPTLNPLLSWPGTQKLWKLLLLRALGDQLLSSNTTSASSAPTKSTLTSSSSNVQGILRTLFPSSFLAIWLILILLVSYLLVLGPVRLFLMSRLKNRSWNWRIILIAMLVFSLLSYGLALQQKGTSIISSSLSVVRLERPDARGSMAHVTNYIGVFVPNQGDFQVHIPGSNLVQSTNEGSLGQNSSPPTTITSMQNGVDVKWQGVNIWTLRTLVAQTQHRIAGGITSQLTLQHTTLIGTITSTLAYPLHDVYVLMSGHYVALGNLASGQTKQVHQEIPTDDNGISGTSLADQISKSRGLPIPYDPIANNTQPRNALQLHMAMLAAVSGEISSTDCGNNPCGPASVTSSGLVINGNGTYNLATYNQILQGHDPLLLPDAPATLIGWADHLADTAGSTTINGSYTSKVQGTLVQAPLDLSFVGPQTLASNFMQSQLVDIQNQGTSIQALSPGIYTMTSGSLTFEYTLPAVSNLNASLLLVSMSNNLPHPGGTAQGANITDANNLQVSLYNWQTQTWDMFTFVGFSFSTNSPQQYISPTGHILLQLSNPNTQNTILFGKPTMEVDGP